MVRIEHVPIEAGTRGFRVTVAALLAVVALGLASAHHMEVAGHVVTGMSNQIVWGLPHVFAVFLIVSASGALNVASVASVFGQAAYAGIARLSAVLAVALLAGGLAVLVLDLGRPDRLAVAMTHYNFRSVFAWNVFLYTGFVAVVAAYLWVQMEPRMRRYAGRVGLVAFVWRIVLTTGTGCIFGFLVARPAYDAAIMAPLFVAMSLSLGTAVFVLVLLAASAWTGSDVGAELHARLRRLLGVFVAATLYLALVQHVANLYVAEHHRVERFLLADGGVYPLAFWLGQVLLGSLAPMWLLLYPRAPRSRGSTAAAAALVAAGGIAQIFVIIIGGQAWPLEIFPGHDVLESGFFDGVVASYRPSLPEIGLAAGGVALALLVVVVAARVLSLLPAGDPEASA